MKPALLKTAARALDLFATEVRLEILVLLGEGPRSVTDISRELELDISNVSKHLRILEVGGLARFDQDGKLRLYALTNLVEVQHLAGGVRLTYRGGPIEFTLLVRMPDETNVAAAVTRVPSEP